MSSEQITIGKRTYDRQDPKKYVCIFCGGTGKKMTFTKNKQKESTLVEMPCSGCNVKKTKFVDTDLNTNAEF